MKSLQDEGHLCRCWLACALVAPCPRAEVAPLAGSRFSWALSQARLNGDWSNLLWWKASLCQGVCNEMIWPWHTPFAIRTGPLSTSAARCIVNLYSESSAGLLHAMYSSNVEESAFETDFINTAVICYILQTLKKTDWKETLFLIFWIFRSLNACISLPTVSIQPWYKPEFSNTCMMSWSFSSICFSISYFIYILCFVVKCLTTYPVNLWTYWIYCYFKT